uniref:Family with sequence similarity 83 member C n=1 Tax=Nothobranchius furzeri TaxID=105023 RepID=A0A8C6NML2_NOTFU
PHNPGYDNGKLASRLEEVKSPWRQGSALELSHNEAARLATDALLEHGEKEYRRVLTDERELNFLSQPEIRYITQYAASRSCGSDSNPNDRDFGDGDAVSELTSGTYFPMMSDEDPPMLELGWPDSVTKVGPSESKIYFQRDKSQNIKDLIRNLINRAKKVIALVMDMFTDVDLLCDLMEASNKRRVPVYVLLDDKNLSHFTDMCSALDIQSSHLSVKRYWLLSPVVMVISVVGVPCFTWLSSQVHSNMVMHFSGSIVDSFDREFRCLYADSQVIDRFSNQEDEGIDLLDMDSLNDRQRERAFSENSSSHSSNSVSSIKAAPGMKPNRVYNITLNDEKEPAGSSHLSPERRGLGVAKVLGLPPTVRDSSNGGANPSAISDRPPPAYGQKKVNGWNMISPEINQGNVFGPSSKFQELSLYDRKYLPNLNPNLNPKGQRILPANDKRPYPKHWSPVSCDNFSDVEPAKEKEPHNFRRSPSPRGSSPWVESVLCSPEQETLQGPLPPTSPPAFINRHDQKRMTLGHSKLDLVNQYNKKPKQVYSRFELKNSN